MANLIDVSQIEAESEVGRSAAGLLLQHSPMLATLDRLNAFELDATEFDWDTPEATATLQTRGRGGEFTASNLAPGTKQTGSLYFHGDAVDIDKSDIRDMELGLRDVNAHMQKKLVRKMRDFARKFDNVTMLGTGGGSPAQLKGLTSMLNGVDDIPGFTGEKGVINAAEFSPASSPLLFDLSNSAYMDAFYEALLAWLDTVPNHNALLMEKALFSRMTTLARKLGLLSIVVDQFGRRLQAINETPMIRLADGSILTDEADDDSPSNAETTSLYIARFGEMDCSLVTNSGLAWKEFDPSDKQSERYKWEIRSAWKIEQKDAIRRVRNIKVSTFNAA